MDDELTYKELAARAIEHFDISKYSNAASLGILDWRSAISLRQHLHLNIETKMQSDQKWHVDRLKAYVRRISESPLSTLRATHRTYDPTVTEMTVLDAWGLRASIELHLPATAARIAQLDALETPEGIDLATISEQETDALLERVQKAQDLNEELSVPFRQEMKREDYDDPYIYLSVDCSAPDDVVLDHFKEWLAAYRKEAGKKTKSISEADMRKWAQHRVLPYIDLKILSKLAGVELTNYTIGGRIFPDLVDVDIAEKVRKTTAPLADWLLGEDGENSLYAVANAEQRRLVGRNWG